MAARLGVFVVAAFVLTLEYILAAWLVIDGPLGALEHDGRDPVVNVTRTSVLAAIVIAAVVLHLRSRANAEP